MSKSTPKGVHAFLTDKEHIIVRAVVDQEGISASALAARALMAECRRLMRYRGTLEEITTKAHDFIERRNKALEAKTAPMPCDESEAVD